MRLKGAAALLLSPDGVCDGKDDRTLIRGLGVRFPRGALCDVSGHCGSPEIVEGSLCRFSVEGGVLVVDRGLSAGGAVAALVVVEAVAPLQYDRLGLVSGFEVVSGQDFPFQAGEERLGGGVVEARPDPAHGLGDFEPPA